ncbi:MAG: P-loop NTPase [Planctomycetota bacterium]|nr:P-loop NTPase [Planctomycetota bacterium]
MDFEPGIGESLGRRLAQRWMPYRRGSSRDLEEARVIAVASGKGGTGKSFLVTNLAVALHRRGRRVAVVDCDFGLGNAHLLFGVNPRLTMHHLLSGLAPVGSVLSPTEYGPWLIAGGSGISGLAELERRHFEQLAQSLGILASQYDVLLLDCAAGLAPQSLLTALLAESLVVVTNPEIAALTDAYALIKCIARQSSSPDLHVAVNRVAKTGQGEPTFFRLAEVTRRFVGRSIHYVGEVVESPDVSHRRLGQPPLIVSHPECTAAQAILEVMESLEQEMGPLAARQVSGEGVEQRLLRLLQDS